jgi:hypothetical protein
MPRRPVKISRSIFSPIGNSQALPRQTEQNLKQLTMSMEPNTFDHINSLTTLTTEQKSELLDLIQWEWERGWAEGYETATLHSTHSLVPDPTTPPAITPINEGEVWFRIYDPITGEGESEVTLAELYGENRDTLTIDEYMELCRMGEWETMMLGRFRVVRLGNDR